jgi:hypothetical protein
MVSRGKPGNPRPHLVARKRPVSSHFTAGIEFAGSACHAEGRGFESHQPLSKRASICRPFLRTQSACASASGRTDSGLVAGRSSADPRKTLCLQVDSGSSEPKSFCRPAEGRVFCLLRPLARLLLQGHDPADGARRRDTSGRGPWGPVRFQSGNREADLGPLRDLASHGSQSRDLSRRTASEAAAHNGELVPRQSREVIAEGVAFHRQAGVCAHLGWAPARRPTQ